MPNDAFRLHIKIHLANYCVHMCHNLYCIIAPTRPPFLPCLPLLYVQVYQASSRGGCCSVFHVTLAEGAHMVIIYTNGMALNFPSAFLRLLLGLLRVQSWIRNPRVTLLDLLRSESIPTPSLHQQPNKTHTWPGCCDSKFCSVSLGLITNSLVLTVREPN